MNNSTRGCIPHAQALVIARAVFPDIDDDGLTDILWHGDTMYPMETNEDSLRRDLEAWKRKCDSASTASAPPSQAAREDG